VAPRRNGIELVALLTHATPEVCFGSANQGRWPASQINKGTALPLGARVRGRVGRVKSASQRTVKAANAASQRQRIETGVRRRSVAAGGHAAE
jgi:hypothetical protein